MFPPPTAAKPDDTNPVDLQPEDSVIEPQATFDHTGFRVPLIVISPFGRKSYVSHTTADSAAILKFIETRLGIDHMTKRDESQINMTELLNSRILTPHTPPDQPIAGKCNPTNPPSPASITP